LDELQNVEAGLRKNYASVDVCVEVQPFTIGGSAGLMKGFKYLAPVPSGASLIVCDWYWFGSNSEESVLYSYREFAPDGADDFKAVDEIAFSLRESIRWLLA
jgi:hypothetical protein